LLRSFDGPADAAAKTDGDNQILLREKRDGMGHAAGRRGDENGQAGKIEMVSEIVGEGGGEIGVENDNALGGRANTQKYTFAGIFEDGTNNLLAFGTELIDAFGERNAKVGWDLEV
jgi:hypothetical protein